MTKKKMNISDLKNTRSIKNPNITQKVKKDNNTMNNMKNLVMIQDLKNYS
jgi:hypothetical protein